jgi:hypothetical protein
LQEQEFSSKVISDGILERLLFFDQAIVGDRKRDTYNSWQNWG